MTIKFLGVLLLFLAVLPRAVHAAAEIVLLRSDSTAAFLRANGGNYEALMAPWNGFFSRKGLKVRQLPAAELAAVKSPAALILPSSVALSEAERKAVRARVAAGWSVLGTWALGVRDEKGAWQGYGFVQELFGVEVVPDSTRRKHEFLLPFGETPLTHGVPAGKRMYLQESSEPFLRLRARNTAARIGNYSRDPTQAGALLGAAAFEERAGARRAYFGVPETTWDTARDDFDAILVGTLDWLGRKPIVLKSAWPHPYQAAVLLEMDTEHMFDNSLRFAQQLERFGIRGTFYSLTSEAVKHAAVIKRLAPHHEIGYHAEVHDGFAKVERSKQDARLGEMARQLGTVLPNAKAVAKGFRAPHEEYDATTEKLLRAHGLRYHAASPAAREDALPGFSSAEAGVSPDEAIVVLPRTWLDDIAIFKAGNGDQSSVEKILLASLQDTVAMRGFGLLSLHTQNFSAGSVWERALPRLLEGISKRKDIWPAPGEAIERWWRDREALQLTAVHDNGALRVRLKVARGPVKGMQLVLMPPSAKPPRLEGSARLERLDDYRWAIVLPELQPGASELRVTF
jgi:peptidoglycan/xylan/chitin deacetylase (PgdA/CDA1 family)